MLPAAFSAPQGFVEGGLVAAGGTAGGPPRLDVVLVFAGLSLEHVMDRSVLTRLREEIILPSRALGCTLRLGGISLGGYLALCGAERCQAELAGLCLFAPYLGSHLVTAEIERAGGLAHWRPGPLPEEDEERRVWRYIATLVSAPLPGH